MTAQIADTFVYQQQEYSLAGINGSGLFDPQQHGLSPVMLSTACWRGYVCTYEVADDVLYLTRLDIGLNEHDRKLAERGEGPVLFGQVPRRFTNEGERSWRSSEFGYDDLRAVIPFTGGLLLGRDFIREMYVHMGFHPAYKYRVVHELIFEKGQLVKAADKSAEMAEFRDMLARRPLQPGLDATRPEIEQWIKKSFSQEYRW